MVFPGQRDIEKENLAVSGEFKLKSRSGTRRQSGGKLQIVEFRKPVPSAAHFKIPAQRCVRQKRAASIPLLCDEPARALEKHFLLFFFLARLWFCLVRDDWQDSLIFFFFSCLLRYFSPH